MASFARWVQGLGRSRSPELSHDPLLECGTVEHDTAPDKIMARDAHVQIKGTPTTLDKLLEIDARIPVLHQYGMCIDAIRIPPVLSGVQLVLVFPWDTQPLDVLLPIPKTYSVRHPPAVLSMNTPQPISIYPYTPRANRRDVLQDVLHMQYTTLQQLTRNQASILHRREGAHDGCDYFVYTRSLSEDRAIRLELLRLLDDTIVDPSLPGARLDWNQAVCLPAAICTAMADEITIHAVDYTTGIPIPPDEAVLGRMTVYIPYTPSM